jgi:hypothetical protein
MQQQLTSFLDVNALDFLLHVPLLRFHVHVYVPVSVLVENEYDAFLPLALRLIRVSLIFDMNCVFSTNLVI